MPRFWDRLAVCLALMVSCLTFMFWQPSRAQVGGGISWGQQDLIRQVRETAAAMREYRKTHDRFPQLRTELDDALMFVVKRVSLTPIDPAIPIESRNNYRTFYQFSIAFDQSIRALPVINGIVKPPDSWQAPPNSIVIMSDGANQFAVWAASGDMRPISDPNTYVPLIINETIEPKPPDSDSSPSSN